MSVSANANVLPKPKAASVGGTWTPLTNQPPVHVSPCLLLTDGRVVCHEETATSATGSWYALTPDSNGSYLNGSWSVIQMMPLGYAPAGFSSAVLADGRMIVMGGESSCFIDCNTAFVTGGAIYDPVSNIWTPQAPPSGWTEIGDAPAVVLADGRYMQGVNVTNQTAVLNPSTLTWTPVAGTPERSYGEEGWVLLPDGTVLKVDCTNLGQTERYNPATNVWTSAGSTPSVLPEVVVRFFAPEVGPGLLRPDGTVFWIGAAFVATTGHTAIYNTNTNTWSAGPDIPNQDGGNDAPAAVLPDGNVLAQLSPGAIGPDGPTFGAPSRFYEFDGANLTQVASPVGCGGSCNFPSFAGHMLVLPTGQVLVAENFSNVVELYTSLGTPSASWLPTIISVPTSVDRGKTYTISGTQFNGLDSGSAYGDDFQNATNYPLARITNRATGHVLYARTHDHSTMAVATGSAIVSTQFDVPVNMETGSSDIEVVANGIASAKTAITITAASTPPTATIALAAGQADITGSSPVNFTVVFSEPVTGFSGSGVVPNGTAGATTAVVTGSGTTYNVAISGILGPGSVNVAVLANVVTGATSGLANLAAKAAYNSVYYEQITPISVGQTILSPLSSTFTLSGVGQNADFYRFTIDSPQNLLISDNAVGIGGIFIDTMLAVFDSNMNMVASDDDSGGGPYGTNSLITHTFAPGTYTIVATSFNAGEFGYYNLSLALNPAPSVTIDQAPGQADPTSASPINFTAVFSEAVTGFGNSGVALSGTAGATTADVTGSGTTYNVAVSGMTGSGTVIATVNAGAATGAVSGLASLASTSTDNSVTYSNTPIKKIRGQLTSE